jgi:hypothetical protein
MEGRKEGRREGGREGGKEKNPASKQANTEILIPEEMTHRSALKSYLYYTEFFHPAILNTC